MSTLSDSTGPAHKAADKPVIKTLSATFLSVAGFFAAEFGGLEPPYPEAMNWFLPICAVVGVLVGAGMFLWRRSRKAFDRRILYIAAAICAAIGLLLMIFYAMENLKRVTTIGDGERVVITNKLTSAGAKIFAENQAKFYLAACDGVTEQTVEITWPCANEGTAVLGHGYAQLFDGVSLQDSKNLLASLYYLMAFSLIVAIYLLVDEVEHRLHKSKSKKAASSAQNANANAQPGR